MRTKEEIFTSIQNQESTNLGALLEVLVDIRDSLEDISVQVPHLRDSLDGIDETLDGVDTEIHEINKSLDILASNSGL